jgi:predicted nucleic acid-binding protein
VIVYCDTSALVKLFVEEKFSDTVSKACEAASHVAVSQIAWVEMCAALSLKERTGQIDAETSERALVELRSEWSRYQKLGIDQELIAQAGDFAAQFGLRAYDSVQLATARFAHQHLGSNMAMCCFDNQLNVAAGKLGIPVLEQWEV